MPKTSPKLYLPAISLTSFLLALTLLAWAAPLPAQESGPSFDCAAVESGSNEEMVCRDPALAELDRRLAEIYSQARDKAVNEHPPMLKTEQRGWIKGRDDCWKAENVRACVEQSYVRRIAELQARYRLVAPNGPHFFTCDDTPADEIVVTFFATEPATLIAERGDQVSLMFLVPSGSGAKYQGRNEIFWNKGDAASVQWGYDAPWMQCRKK